jgi:hypothetical protein
MEQLIAKHGPPAFIRSDSGPEFIGRTLGDWLKKQDIKTLYIAPGSHGRTGMSKVSMTSSGGNVWGEKYSIH